jgi:Predicted nucleic acid-binding protein, contains PIN domain
VIVLDTNVISAVMRGDDAASHFLDEVEDPWMSVTTITEIAYGLHRLPEGRRRESLDEHWRTILDAWRNRILLITSKIAGLSGAVMAQRERIGQPVGLADAQIAATCLAHDAAIATGNTRDFEHLGLTIINPWLDTVDS